MRTAICFDDVKSAALYFDRVLPTSFKIRQFESNEVVIDESPLPIGMAVNLAFDVALDGMDYGELVMPGGRWYQALSAWSSFTNDVRPYLPKFEPNGDDIEHLALCAPYLSNAKIAGHRSIREIFRDYSRALGFTHSDVLLPVTSPGPGTEQEDVLISLCRLQLIDSRQATWEQIYELRNDRSSRIKLQRLRAFAEKNYTGKSSSFIEDDLSARVAEYHDVSRKHGFNLVTGSLSSIYDSPLSVAALGGVVVSLTSGSALGFTAGVLLEAGKFALELSKRRRDMVDWKAAHDLAYIIEIDRG